MSMPFESLLTFHFFVINLLKFLLYCLEGGESLKFVQNYLSLVLCVKFFRDTTGIYFLFSLFIIISIKLQIFLTFNPILPSYKAAFLYVSESPLPRMSYRSVYYLRVYQHDLNL